MQTRCCTFSLNRAKHVLMKVVGKIVFPFAEEEERLEEEWLEEEGLEEERLEESVF